MRSINQYDKKERRVITMEPIFYFDRLSKEQQTELVYGASALKLLYGDDLVSKTLGASLLHLLVRNPLFSALYGYWQKSPLSKSKIKPFIDQFAINSTEFADSVDSFGSFNDFFIRKLNPAARPIDQDETTAIIPADARYRFFPNIAENEGFIVKGEKFDLFTLLEDEELAKAYANGSMVMARLCPTDYHRFHFPVDCIPSATHWINGWLYSVNPIALKKDIQIFTKNKRTITKLKTENFGEILYLEIGATNVGSIHQTYVPNKIYTKGDEKGYFAFGASSLILLFEPNKIVFDKDLLELSRSSLEIRCLMGQSMGTIPKRKNGSSIHV